MRDQPHIWTIGLAALLGAMMLLPLHAAAQTPADAAQAVTDDVDWIDVSHSLGFPLGGLGTGYSAFGKFGFVKVNFDGRPTDKLGKGLWEYTDEPAAKSSFGFVVTDGDQTYVLQTTPASWQPEAKPFPTASTSALLPRARAKFGGDEVPIAVTVEAFTPLIPHDIDTSTTPVQVFDVTVENNHREPRAITVALAHAGEGQPVGNRVIFSQPSGQLGFAAEEGEATAKGVSVTLHLTPMDRQTARFYVAWHYPKFDGHKRYYTRNFADASAVLERASKDASSWLKRIDTWHDSIRAPSHLRRIWFGSLSSVMTSSVMTSEPYFYEIETPHTSLSTMDVSLYSAWVYMVNWPELERLDMDMYLKAMPMEGPKKGFVWHSLWNDAAKYVEEPGFLARYYRAHLWFNDPEWSRKGLKHALLAADRVYTEDNHRYLVNSKHGNQSYDIWRMPGVSAYINSSWLFGLHGLERVARVLGAPEPTISGEPISAVRSKASAAYDELLWNDSGGYWNLFHRTEGADKSSTHDSVFSDQLFGKWVLSIDAGAGTVLPGEKVSRALQKVYTHNLVEDASQNFRGWCNGMLPDGRPDITTGYHAKTFWLGPQINLATLLALDGREAEALDVMQSIERSIGDDMLAVGEWNRSLDKDKRVVLLPNEPEKDTPRFAPYPRYKSSWEWLPRVLGMTMDEKSVYLDPFKSIPIELKGVVLAGMKLNVKVEPGWTRAIVNGRPVVQDVALDRTIKEHTVQFVR